MEHKILGFTAAIANGLNPRDYSFEEKDIPIGDFEAYLDFMVWSKNQVAINCYFTTKEGVKIQLTAFRDKITRKYVAGDYNFYDASIGIKMMLTTKHNSKKNLKFINAKLL